MFTENFLLPLGLLVAIALFLVSPTVAQPQPSGSDVVQSDSTVIPLPSALPLEPGASDAFKQALKEAYHAFAVLRDYKVADTLFAKLLAGDTRQSDKDLLHRLRNATLYSLGNHDAALDLICERSRALAATDDRYIYDIHAHLRKIALNSGYETATTKALRYKETCSRRQFSPMWVGIPLAKMEFLRAGTHVLGEAYVLPIKDRIVLRQLIKKYPNDPFKDYASYFLHDFKAIKRPELIGLPSAPDETVKPTARRSFGTLTVAMDTPIDDILKEFASDDADTFSGHYIAYVFRRLLGLGRGADALRAYRSLPPRLAALLEEIPHVAIRSAINEQAYLEERLAQAPLEQRAKLRELIEAGECAEDLAVCRLAIEWIPHSNTARRVLAKTTSSALQDPQNTPELLAGLAKLVREYSKVSTSPAIRAMSRELDYARDTLHDHASENRQALLRIYASGACEETALCTSFLKTFKASSKARGIALDHLTVLIYSSNLETVNAFYESIPPEVFAVKDRQFLGDTKGLELHLYRISSYLKQGDVNGLLSYAIQIRGRIFKREDKPKKPKIRESEPERFPTLALRVFAYIAESRQKTTLGERAHYLWFTTSLHRTHVDKSKPILEAFIDRYPTSHLIDDAYTELGLLVLQSEGDRKLAEHYFRKVWKEYPNRNAADNALYYLAEMALKEGNYVQAIYYYTLIVTHFSKKRIAESVADELPPLQGLYEALRDRKYPDGLVFTISYGGANVVMVDPKRVASDFPIAKGDLLTTIAGETFASERGFYHILSRLSSGSQTEATFSRSKLNTTTKKWETQSINALLNITEVAVFDVQLVGPDDVLYLRPEPGDLKIDSGQIPHDAKCLKYVGPTRVLPNKAVWYKIEYAEGSGPRAAGWVNSRFLRRSSACLD